MIAIGAQYYRPPNPPREDWARDLARMGAAGMNTVKLWACWSWMEPRPGEYDFADLDELMELAQAAGLRVVINTIIENAPYWLEAAHPEARYRDSEDRVIHLTAAMNTPGGGWPGLCFDNASVWEAAARFLDALVARYDAHPALEAWDVWNEPHLEPASYFPERLYCYCDASLTAFRQRLRNRHGSLESLNAAWERRYSDWNQVDPPRIFEAVPDMLDWREFWFDNLASWLRRRVEVVRARARAGRTVMTHVALSGFTGQLATHTLDEFTLTRDVDVYGTSSFPTWLMDDDHVEHLMNLETARDAASGKPFWQAELQGGRGRRAGASSTGQPDPAVVALWMWNALATGATGVVFWQWRSELLGPESPGYGLTTPDGSLTGRVTAVTSMAATARRPELLDRTSEPGRVGLLLSRASALHAYATDRGMQLYTRAAMGGYRLLVDADLPVTVLHEDAVAAGGVPAHVEVVLWPMPAVSSDALAGSLTAFVAGGGRLIAESGPGEYQPSGRRRAVVPGGGLRQLFGAVERETTSLPGESVEIAGGSLPFAWQRSELLTDTARPVAWFGDGAVAAVETRSGSGSAVLLAGFTSVAAQRPSTPRAIAAVRGLVGIPYPEDTWAQPGSGLVTRRAVAANGAPLTFVMNWTTADTVFLARRPVGVLRAGGREDAVPDGEVLVPGRSGALLIGR